MSSVGHGITRPEFDFLTPGAQECDMAGSPLASLGISGADFPKDRVLIHQGAVCPNEARLAVPDVRGFGARTVHFEDLEVAPIAEFIQRGKANIETAKMKIDNVLCDLIEGVG